MAWLSFIGSGRACWCVGGVGDGGDAASKSVVQCVRPRRPLSARVEQHPLLHYYSDHPALAAALLHDDSGVHPIDLIKEFEAVSRAWKACLAEALSKGYATARTPLQIHPPLGQRFV